MTYLVKPRLAIARQRELAGTLSRFNDLFSKAPDKSRDHLKLMTSVLRPLSSLDAAAAAAAAAIGLPGAETAYFSPQHKASLALILWHSLRLCTIFESLIS